jgi:hypothetical protein
MLADQADSVAILDDGAWINDLRSSGGQSGPFVAQSLTLLGVARPSLHRQPWAQKLQPFLENLNERVSRRRSASDEPKFSDRSSSHGLLAEPAHLAVLLSTAAFSGCAISRSGRGMTGVVNVAGPCRSSTTDTAVQKALFNNRGLQTSYNDLALGEPVLVQESQQQNPTFSVFGRVGNGTLEAERQVGGSIPTPWAPPFRFGIARQHFRQAQLRCRGGAAMRSETNDFRVAVASELPAG